MAPRSSALMIGHDTVERSPSPAQFSRSDLSLLSFGTLTTRSSEGERHARSKRRLQTVIKWYASCYWIPNCLCDCLINLELLVRLYTVTRLMVNAFIGITGYSSVEHLDQCLRSFQVRSIRVKLRCAVGTQSSALIEVLPGRDNMNSIESARSSAIKGSYPLKKSSMASLSY